jgi:transcription initiation factor IIE alpha subunit
MQEVTIPIARVKKKDFRVEAQKLVTGRTAIISQTGAGKSWTIGVICEQLCKNNIGFCIIDTEGEYFSLKEKFQLLWVGKDPMCDLDIEKIDLSELALTAMEKNVPLIFDVSEVLDERKMVAGISKALYEAATKLRVPYLLIIEEADKFVPQRGRPMKEIGEISRRGRKRGLGLMLASQRPAFLNKDVLSQCDNQLVGKLTTEADLAAVNLFFATRRELEELPKLKPGEFFALGSIVERKTRIHVIGRETTHKGFTPKLLPKPVGTVSEIREKLMSCVPVVPPAPPAVPAPAVPVPPPPEAVPVKLRAFAPKISREEVLSIAEAKKRKKYGLFGPKEMLMSTELNFYPLVFVEIRYATGIIKKSIKTSSFVLEGSSGDFVEIEKGFKVKKGFSDFLGLGENPARVLVEIHRAKRATVVDLEAKTGLSESTIRDAIKNLSERKLITYERVGRARAYLPIKKLTLPGLKHRVEFEYPEEVSISGAKVECRLTEQDLRDVLKAIEPTAEITRFDAFYYPVYTLRFPKRAVRIDGLTGREVWVGER